MLYDVLVSRHRDGGSAPWGTTRMIRLSHHGRPGWTVTHNMIGALDQGLLDMHPYSFLLGVLELRARHVLHLCLDHIALVRLQHFCLGLWLGLVVIHWFLRYVQTKSFGIFVWYRVVLGIVLYILLGTGVLAAV